VHFVEIEALREAPHFLSSVYTQHIFCFISKVQVQAWDLYLDSVHSSPSFDSMSRMMKV